MKPEVLVQLEDISRSYGEHEAVRQLDLRLERGEVLGLLGPNGAGKSTTMQMISGNLAPSAGRITIAGIDLLEHPRQAKARLGYLPENPPLYRELTVDEYLNFCARLNRVPRRAVAAAVTNAKARCGLGAVGRRLIGNLSKGYRQRVGIAQAIVHGPAVVILDEPTVGLDPIQMREIRTLIGELGNEHGVILSTHILPEVLAVCSRVDIIHQGRLVFSDSVAGLTRDAHAASTVVGLQHPPEVDALRSVGGVTGVEPLGNGRFRLHHAPGTEPGAALAERAVNDRWGLRELTPEQVSLESIFIELTCADAPEAPA